VPVLLLAKPFLLSQQHQYQPVIHHGEDDDDDHDHSEHKQEPFAEILIHQAIETIEFVLGMISNTASYLRLWALSLAHTELATVFWEKAMLSTLNMNWFAAYIGFAVFAGVTIGVLLMMDVLECFLHSLRLHWVEFQGKFFKADGVRFTPYSFKQLIKDSA
jgi:V-type H+-transporting ATPase subunit a